MSLLSWPATGPDPQQHQASFAAGWDLLGADDRLPPKPTVFPDEIAVALDLGLDLGAAVHAATEKDDGELDAEQLEHRDRAYELVGELVDRGLLERLRRRGAPLDTPPELTLHPANVQVIRDYLPLDAGKRAQANERAEAFYRVRVGETVSGSFDSRSGWSSLTGGTTRKSGSITSATSNPAGPPLPSPRCSLTPGGGGTTTSSLTPVTSCSITLSARGYGRSARRCGKWPDFSRRSATRIRASTR